MVIKQELDDQLCIIDNLGKTQSRYSIKDTDTRIQPYTGDLQSGIYTVYLQSNPSLKARFTVVH